MSFLNLEATEAKQELRGKNLVSIASQDMESLKIKSGSFVEIGEKKLIFRAIRTEDGLLGRIGMDGSTRQILGVSLGEKIKISLSTKKLGGITRIEISVLESENIPSEAIEKQVIPELKKEEYQTFFRSVLSGSPAFVRQKFDGPLSMGGERIKCAVTKILPKNLDLGLVEEKTKIEISSSVGGSSGVNVHYEDIGGLEEEIEKIREMVEFPMKHPKIFERLGISAPKGVLLTGPPGTGKTLLAKAVATETDAKFISIAGPEIMSKYHGGSEENLRGKFEEAQKNAPAIIFIDEIDAIAPKRGETNDQAEKRVVTQLLTLMDGLKSRGQVVVMAATNRPEDLDEALRRPGRFDRELRINPPTEEGRRKILEIHTRNMPLEDKEEILTEFSNKTIGYTGADLEVLCKEAALHSVKPFYSEIMNLAEDLERIETEEKTEKEGKEVTEKRNKLLNNLIVRREDFVYAMKMVEPSAMREVLIHKPQTKWGDVGGLSDAKDKLRELIELPLLRPDLYKAAGIKASKGVLLHGPPGTGKTLLAKAVANEANANFISVKGPELISKWVGESEKHVREIFKKAKQVAPAIIFFDEFDSISKSRGSGFGNDSSEKVVNQLLTELDGVEELENVMIIAATNRKDLIDPALLRPGRIDSQVELPLPDEKTRKEIFKVHMKEMPAEKAVDIEAMAKKIDGWTGADIEAVVRFAGINSIKRNYKIQDRAKLIVTKADFDFALKEVQKNKGEPESGKPDMEGILKTLPKMPEKTPKTPAKKKVAKK